MSAPERFDSPIGRDGSVVKRQGRLAAGWVVVIALCAAFALLLVLALLLRSAWWKGEGPMTLTIAGIAATAQVSSAAAAPPPALPDRSHHR